MSSSTSPTSPDLETFAAYCISTIVNSALLGVLTVQTYCFYVNFASETLLLKIWIAITLVVHYAHTIIASSMTYITLIHHFPEAYTKERMLWMPFALEILEAISTFLTQIWFARRQYHRTSNLFRILCSIINSIALSDSSWKKMDGNCNSLHITSHASIWISRDYILTRECVPCWATWLCWLQYVWFGGNVLGDILVTVPIAISLYRTRTAFPSTNRLIVHLTHWIIATGILTTTVACIVLIVYVTKKESNLYIPLNRFLSSLYANSLLAFLNRRPYWEREAKRDAELHISGTPMGWSTPIPLLEHSQKQKFGDTQPIGANRISHDREANSIEHDRQQRGQTASLIVTEGPVAGEW